MDVLAQDEASKTAPLNKAPNSEGALNREFPYLIGLNKQADVLLGDDIQKIQAYLHPLGFPGFPPNISIATAIDIVAKWFLLPENFYFFSACVLGRDLEPNPHLEMSSIAVTIIRDFEMYWFEGYVPPPDYPLHSMNLMPRGSFKSTVLDQCLGVYMGIRYPNVRVLIDSETVTKAEVFMSDIKSHFEDNELLKRLYGELKGDDWNNSTALLNNRTKQGIREATYMTCGVGKSMPGMHYDMIIGDDYVSDQNTGTFEQIEKVLRHIRQAKSLLDPGAIHVLIGTHWTFDDPYVRIYEDPVVSKKYRICIRSCGGKHSPDDNGQPTPLYFPNRLNENYLQAQLDEQKMYMFSCQYILRPQSDGEKVFDPNNYNFISQSDFLALIRTQPHRWYYFADLAMTEEKIRRGDWTALSPYVTFSDGSRYLVNAKACKVGVDELPETIYKHYVETTRLLGSPSFNGAAHIESVGFQKLLFPALKQLTNEHKVRINWKAMKPENKESKEVRIRSAAPYLSAGDLWIVDTAAIPSKGHLDQISNRLLVNQATQFPMAQNDDMLDNQGYMIQLAKLPKGSERKKQNKSWDERDAWEDKERRPHDPIKSIRQKEALKRRRP
jgi:hypothetical protein